MDIPVERWYRVVTPIGYAADALTFVEKTMKAFVKSGRRKSLEELVVSGTFQEEWQRSALESTRLAPSAVNRQPWRFRLEPGAVGVTMDEAGPGGVEAKRLDCGIAMLHLELGARSAGVEGSWEFSDDPGVAVFRKKY
jgi:hypothetical protein